jgi:hypothetical protein
MRQCRNACIKAVFNFLVRGKKAVKTTGAIAPPPNADSRGGPEAARGSGRAAEWMRAHR